MPNFLAAVGQAMPAIGQMQQQQAVQNAMQQEATVRAMQIKDMQAQQQALDVPIPFEHFQAHIANLDPDSQKIIMDAVNAVPNGVKTVGPNKFINRRTINAATGALKSNTELDTQLNQNMYQGLISKEIGLQGAISEAQASGNTKKAEQLQSQLKQVTGQRTNLQDVLFAKEQMSAKAGFYKMLLQQTFQDQRQKQSLAAAEHRTGEQIAARKEIAGAGTGKPSYTDAQIRQSLRDKLSREPTAGEFLDAQAKQAGVKAGETAGKGTIARLGAEFNALKSAGVKFDEETGKIDMKTVPVETRNTASLIASYQMPLPSGFALRSPYWQGVLAVVKDVNPGFNAIEYEARLHALNAANNPTFVRMRTNANILANPPIDKKTGKPTGQSELDKIVAARNAIEPGIFGTISQSLRSFNSWDQFLAYQVSNPVMAKFKALLIANIERLGSVYQGGGTVTSDFKMQLAREFLDPALSKPAFSELVETHRESISRTLADYSNSIVGGLQGVPLQTPPGASAEPKEDLSKVPINTVKDGIDPKTGQPVKMKRVQGGWQIIQQ